MVHMKKYKVVRLEAAYSFSYYSQCLGKIGECVNIELGSGIFPTLYDLKFDFLDYPVSFFKSEIEEYGIIEIASL